MGTALSGSYDAHDKRQVNRATIGEGTIIIRSDPAQGLAGLNRDLQKAQELTKDSKISVTVYVDPAAVKEVAGGFEGIQDSYEKIAELVKKALPGAAKSIDCKLNYYEKLTKAGHSPEDAQKIVQELGPLVTLDYDLTALADKFGGFDKIPVGELAALLDKARTSTDVQLAFNGEGAGVIINSDALAKSQWLVYIGMLDRVSEASGALTLLVHDYICAKAYLLGDTSKKAEYNRYNKTIDDSLAAIKDYISHPVDGLTNTYSNWTAQLDAIVRAQNSGDAGTTMRLLGGLSRPMTVSAVFPVHACLNLANHSSAISWKVSRSARFSACWPFRTCEGSMPLAMRRLASSRRSRASLRLTSGYTPSERRFSLPAIQSCSSHHYPPATDISS